MRRHYVILKEATKSCLCIVADKMYTHNLINREVRSEPSFEKIEGEFLVMMSLFKDDIDKIEEQCRLFFLCIASADGPAKHAAISLAKDWESEVFQHHQISFSLQKMENEQVMCCPQIKLDCSDSIVKEMDCLQKNFARIIRDMREFYDQSNISAITIARWVEAFNECIGEIACHDTDIDKVFQSMKSHYNFLDIDLIKNLVETYPLNNEPPLLLESRFSQYVMSHENFVKHVDIDCSIKASIEAALDEQGGSKTEPKVVLKLSGRWENRNLENLKKLTNFLFQEDAKYLTITKINRGCLMIKFLVSSKNCLQSLTCKMQAKLHLLSHIGIFKVIIDRRAIVDNDENPDFTFEASLLNAIRNIDNDNEYERITLLLIDFNIQINYQNSKGDTALLYASESGHIEIFKKLLVKGAYTFVQRPSKGYIGLNSLACTALSQHISKSSGGEKIVPQEGTSVKDILDIAVQRSGINYFLYHSFVMLIFGKLQERLQKLHQHFQFLDNKFTATANELIGIVLSLKDARQSLLLYIKANSVCDNVQQLLNLLQPHYSNLNINLLKTIGIILDNQELKREVDSYILQLNQFKNITTLLEFTIASKEMNNIQPQVSFNCSKIVLKFNKPWGSKTITELNKLDELLFFQSSSYLNLVDIELNQSSSIICTYLVPSSQTELIRNAAAKQCDFLFKIGVFEVHVDDFPLMVEAENTLFKFEESLQKAHQNNDEPVLFFLLELNAQLPSITPDTAVPLVKIDKNSALQFEIDDEPGLMREELVFEAIKRHDIRKVQILLNKGCDIDYMGEEKLTFVMMAVLHGNTEIVKLLLENNPNIDLQDHNGNNALMMASSRGYNSIAHLLLQQNPVLDKQNNEGMTALMLAACNGRENIVRQLLKEGACTDITNLDGKTAWTFAMDHGYPHIADLM